MWKESDKDCKLERKDEEDNNNNKEKEKGRN